MPSWFEWLADAGVELVILFGVLASILRGLADFYRNRPGRGRPAAGPGDHPSRPAPVRPLAPTSPREPPTRRPAKAGAPKTAAARHDAPDGARPGGDGKRAPDAAAPPAASMDRPPARPGRAPRPGPGPTTGPWGDLWGELMRQLEDLLGETPDTDAEKAEGRPRAPGEVHPRPAGDTDGAVRRPGAAEETGREEPIPWPGSQETVPGEGAPGEEGTPGVEGRPGREGEAGPRGRRLPRPRPPRWVPVAGDAQRPGDGSVAAASPVGETVVPASPAATGAPSPAAAMAPSRVMPPEAVALASRAQRRTALRAAWLWLEVLSPPRALRPWHPGPDPRRPR